VITIGVDAICQIAVVIVQFGRYESLIPNGPILVAILP
jgi:hypothetical protein